MICSENWLFKKQGWSQRGGLAALDGGDGLRERVEGAREVGALGREVLRLLLPDLRGAPLQSLYL